MRGTESGPVQVTYTSANGKVYGPYDVEAKYGGGDCGSLGFHFTIETVTEPGTWKVSAIYPPLKLDMDTQFEVVMAEQPYPDTWINWVRAKPTGPNIPYGVSTPSSTVIVDFQGTVKGPGSHIDLKIDSGSYVPVASPHTITGLSDGPHTIYLKAVNQAGKADPTPAKWTFTVINDNDD